MIRQSDSYPTTRPYRAEVFHQQQEPPREFNAMNEFDSSGYAVIHQSAKKGYVKAVEKFVLANRDDQLEFKTNDELHETPLLVAVRAGDENIETIDVLINLEANLSAKNSLGHGIPEICCMMRNVKVLEHFIGLGLDEVPVWARVLKLLASSTDNECECSARCLCALTARLPGDVVNPHWKPLVEYGGVPALVRVVKGTPSDAARIQALSALNNVLSEDEIKNLTNTAGGIPTLIKNIKSPNDIVVELSAVALGKVGLIRAHADQAAQQGAIPALLAVMNTNRCEETLTAVVDTLGVLNDLSEERQTMTNQGGGVETLHRLSEEHDSPELLLALTRAVAKVTRRHSLNQTTFVDLGGSILMISLLGMRNKDIQMAAVECIHMLVEANSYTQNKAIEEGAVMPLLNLLKRTRKAIFLAASAAALWAIAGNDDEEKMSMAVMIGVQLLIEFLNVSREEHKVSVETLYFIGSEGLGVLAQGPQGKQTEIGQASGVQPLVRLLKTDQEHLVLSAIRSLRHLCVGTGYVPHTANQNTIQHVRGIKLLIALMSLSRNDLIQAEAALTLASVSLGNQEVIEEVMQSSQSLEFSYVKILKLLYSKDRVVNLLAGAALATFAYNNLSQQQGIAAEGGVRFDCFESFLNSDDEYFRCNAAYQIVVLSRVIPDEEQAVSSAAGIKLIVDILNDSKSPLSQALAADCVARLAHTRAGIPAAFVAIEAVDRLCDLMLTRYDRVRGCAAVALSFLSYNHKAERLLLNRCRTDPYLIKCLYHYVGKDRLSPSFVKEWQHYRKIGLPTISVDRPSLTVNLGHRYTAATANRNMPVFDSSDAGGIGVDSIKLTSIAASDTASQRGDNASVIQEDHGAALATGRASRTSRVSFKDLDQSLHSDKLSEYSIPIRYE